MGIDKTDIISFIKERGLHATKLRERGEVFEINGFRVNIKKNQGYNAWFAVSSTFLDSASKKAMDFFIFADETMEFVVIPRVELEKFVKGSSIDRTNRNPTFNVYINSNGKGKCSLNAHNGKGFIDISNFYQNCQLFSDKSKGSIK